jgi:hypothetical protein
LPFPAHIRKTDDHQSIKGEEYTHFNNQRAPSVPQILFMKQMNTMVPAVTSPVLITVIGFKQQA